MNIMLKITLKIRINDYTFIPTYFIKKSNEYKSKIELK